jgi:hypothetical protein
LFSRTIIQELARTREDMKDIGQLRASNRRQARGCFFFALVMSAVGGLAVAIMSFDAAEDQPTEQRSASEPKVVLDARFMPVLNAEIRFDDVQAGPDMIAATARAIGDLGHKIGADHNIRAADAMLVMVADRDGYIMHLTIDVPKLIPAAEKGGQTGNFLLLGREIGFNEIRGERAAREWCAGARNSFCNAVP